MFFFVWKMWIISMFWLRTVFRFDLIVFFYICSYHGIYYYKNCYMVHFRIVLWSVIWVISITVFWISSELIVRRVPWAVIRVVSISRIWRWGVSVIVWIVTSTRVWSRILNAVHIVLNNWTAISVLWIFLWNSSFWWSFMRVIWIANYNVSLLNLFESGSPELFCIESFVIYW